MPGTAAFHKPSDRTEEITAFVAALDATDPETTVAFTGAELTANQLMTHIRSELTVHRWDLLGDDPTSAALLAQPDLLTHGRLVLTHMPTLAEAHHRPTHDRDDLLVLWGRRA